MQPCSPRVAVPNKTSPAVLILILLAPFVIAFSFFLEQSRTPVAEANTGDEKVYYFLNDHLGSVDVVLDDQGKVVERRDYLPYGSQRSVAPLNGVPITELGFTGKRLDDETGLNNYGARYYDPVAGRFIQNDPALRNINKMALAEKNALLSNPQNLNMHAYVQNNPVNYVDPTGGISKSASILSKLVNILTYGDRGQSNGWLAQSARNYATSPNEQTQADVLGKQSEALSRLIADPKSFTDETWDSITTERISTLDPKVQISATDFINAAEESEATTLRVTDGYRSNAVQDQVYAQGRTTPGSIVTNARGGTSYHNYGLAIDVVIMEDSEVKWERVSENIVNLAAGLGFEWGGNWETPDNPHFQMTFGQSIKDLQDKQSEE